MIKGCHVDSLCYALDEIKHQQGVDILTWLDTDDCDYFSEIC